MFSSVTEMNARATKQGKRRQRVFGWEGEMFRNSGKMVEGKHRRTRYWDELIKRRVRNGESGFPVLSTCLRLIYEEEILSLQASF